MKLRVFSQILVYLILPQWISAQAVQPRSPLIKSYEEYLTLKDQSPFGLEWISLGPVLNSARVEAVQAHPARPGTMYIAFGSGNLWKTTNNGLTWKPIFENKPAQGIGDIALAPSNPDIIYAGTGESLRKPRNFTMPGTGVYRSDDGGESWRHIGLDDSWHIGEIAIHPEDPDIAIVAVLGHFWSSNPNRGLFLTEDGGKSWEHVLYIDDKTGGNDVKFSPGDPNIVYASMWENDLPMDFKSYSLFNNAGINTGVSGKNSAVYKSTDSGRTWTKMTNGIPSNENIGRIGVAVSHSDPDKAYAFVDHRLKEDSLGAGEVYRTIDGGATWSKTHEMPLLNLSVIGWYFMDIYVNPKDDDEIFALGVRLANSKDGGETFSFIGGDIYHLFENPAQTLHLDHCELWINPTNPDHMILGNDGGLYVSYDHGQSWTHFNNIPAGEFYDITLDNQDPYLIYGGVQDDATVYGPAVEWDPAFDDQWEYLWIDAWSGGDGCMTYVDPRDPNTVYFSMQHAAVRRKDMQADTSTSIRPELPKDHEGIFKSNFITPYLLSSHDPDKLYLAGNYVFKTEDQGNNWEVISEDLSISGDSLKNSHAAGALAESPIQEGLLFIGTDKGAFWVSEDDGENWMERSDGLPNAYIRSIYPSHHDLNRLYVAMTGINYDDLNCYLYVSEDMGKNWTSMKNNLPNEVANVIIEDPQYENILYTGTLRGVYISLDRGSSWSCFGKNMPPVSVADLQIEPRSKDLIAATHGRGIYKVNLDPMYEYHQNPEKRIFEVPDGVLPKKVDTHKDFDRRTRTKTPITFWLDVSQEVEIQILNNNDSLIFSGSLQGKYGFNQFRWDLITEKVESPSPYFIHYDRYIEPGNYKVRVSTSVGILEEELIVKTYNHH